MTSPTPDLEQLAALQKWNDATLDDLMANPKKYGLPTFQEFQREPGKYRQPEDGDFGWVEKGSDLLRGVIKSHSYECLGYKAKNLETCERIAKDHGLGIMDLDMKPELVQENAGKYSVLVRFTRKHDAQEPKA